MIMLTIMIYQDSTTFRHNSLDLGPSFTVHHSSKVNFSFQKCIRCMKKEAPLLQDELFFPKMYKKSTTPPRWAFFPKMCKLKHHSSKEGSQGDRESLSKIYSLIKPKAGAAQSFSNAIEAKLKLWPTGSVARSTKSNRSKKQSRWSDDDDENEQK